MIAIKNKDAEKYFIVIYFMNLKWQLL